MRKNNKTVPLRKAESKEKKSTLDDNQTIPVLVVRGREVPLVVVDNGHGQLVSWSDLMGRGDEAVCDPGYEIILYRDRALAILCLTRSGQSRLKRNVSGGIGKEWMYNYNIFYIYPRARENERFIDYTSKTPMALNRMVTEGSNIRRWPNNGSSTKDGLGSYFPPELNYTIMEEDPATLLLFELRYGHKRSALSH